MLDYCKKIAASIAQLEILLQRPGSVGDSVTLQEFAKRCLVGVIDRQVVASATKAAQDGATAVTSLVRTQHTHNHWQHVCSCTDHRHSVFVNLEHFAQPLCVWMV